jgi:DNA-binding transcriptional MocR family regulator
MDTSPMPRARYKSLVDTFADDIRSGRLAPGTRLPTHRQLAADQGLALVTASRVYAELEAMGLVSGETGRGTFVREIALPPGQGSGQMNVAAGMLDPEFQLPVIAGPGRPAAHGLAPVGVVRRTGGVAALPAHAGRLHERAAVARHLLSRGLTVEAGQVLLVSGAQHGLAVTLMALLKPGM